MRSKPNNPARFLHQASAGFSLIELLIVVAIILIIAAIAIPNFIRAKISANEAATVSNMRYICTAEVTYTTTYAIGFSATLLNLGGTGLPSSTSAGLIDDILANGNRSGYQYTYVPTFPDPNGQFQSFTINTQPQSPGSTGQRYFYTDQTNVIRQSITTVATSADSPI